MPLTDPIKETLQTSEGDNRVSGQQFDGIGQRR